MCNYFDLCIQNAMTYAYQGNFDKAIDVFISETSNSKCTKYIGRNQLCKIILSQHKLNPKKFEYDMKVFDLYLSCMCD
jgi:hypothetical protein